MKASAREYFRAFRLRRNERTRLLREREALAQETLGELRLRIDITLNARSRIWCTESWDFVGPYKNEYDRAIWLRPCAGAGARRAAGRRAPRTPLVFREWKPGVEIGRRAAWHPYPVGSPEVSRIMCSAHAGMGWRRIPPGLWRRVLRPHARCDKKSVRASSVCHTSPRICGRFYPQPYDIPVDFVVTERGVHRREPQGLKFLDNPEGFSSPACYAGESLAGISGKNQGLDQRETAGTPDCGFVHVRIAELGQKRWNSRISWRGTCMPTSTRP